LIEAAGGVALSLPLFEIASVADPASAAAQLEQARAAQRWIFSSSNAVHYAAELAALPWPPTAAVGPATAAALEALGLCDVLYPQTGDGAAALLAHPVFAVVEGQQIALIAGEQPLPELETVLRARAAQVECIAVYRRRPVLHSPDAVAAAIAQADIAILPSAEALEQLLSLTPVGTQSILLSLQLALPSPRVVEKARSLGFRRMPLLPQRVSDASYLDVLRQHCNPGGQDRPSLIVHDRS
jgi:uroporphyrinogen-III synthase